MFSQYYNNTAADTTLGHKINSCIVVYNYQISLIKLNWFFGSFEKSIDSLVRIILSTSFILKYLLSFGFTKTSMKYINYNIKNYNDFKVNSFYNTEKYLFLLVKPLS